MTKALGDAVDREAYKMFSGLEDPLRTKCRFLYAHRKIRSVEQRDGEVSVGLKERYDEIRDELMEMDIRPSSLLEK